MLFQPAVYWFHSVYTRINSQYIFDFLLFQSIYLWFSSLYFQPGANLSVSYFENRQDRYILIEDCDEIANFFADLVEVVSSFSFQLQVAILVW